MVNMPFGSRVSLANARSICDWFIRWQGDDGGIDPAKCVYHRWPRSGTNWPPGPWAQDLPAVSHALYRIYDVTDEGKYKRAADRYAAYFIKQTHIITKPKEQGNTSPYADNTWPHGFVIEPCYRLYKSYNPQDSSLDDLAEASYRIICSKRVKAGQYFSLGYKTVCRDPAFTDDLSLIGGGLMTYYELFRDNEALKHATGLSRYFITDYKPGTSDGVWSPSLGTWLIGTAHINVFEHNVPGVYTDEAGWMFAAYDGTVFLSKLYKTTRNILIAEKCIDVMKWIFDRCQFDCGAIGLHGRDDKWLGLTGAAIMDYALLKEAHIMTTSIQEKYFPNVTQAWWWLLKTSRPERFPGDGVIYMTHKTMAEPGCNVVWLLAWTALGLIEGEKLVGNKVNAA